MIVTSIRRGRTITTVTLSDVPRDVPNRKVENVALEAAREDRSSLFGIRVIRHDDGTATVDLYTD